MLQANSNLLPLFTNSTVIQTLVPDHETPEDFDFWIPMMSLPRVLGVTLANLPRTNGYLNARQDLSRQWLQRLGPKTRLRAALAWRGRPDSWLNQHKGVPFDLILELIQSHGHIEWHCLQMDATPAEHSVLTDLGVRQWNSDITSWSDTAALLTHTDVVISADTALAHLGGSLGRPTWIMLNRYAQDWRWLRDRSDSPWYNSVRLFRQPDLDQWDPVIRDVRRWLDLFKI
jgi:hypothetical protein